MSIVKSDTTNVVPEIGKLENYLTLGSPIVDDYLPFVYDWQTRNKSYIEMHNYLKDIGIVNNSFMLMLYDSSLVGVDPYSDNLTTEQEARIAAEVANNFWYFAREIVRIDLVGGPQLLPLNRFNMGFFFLLEFDLNVYGEATRQHGKTTAAAVRIAWEYAFASMNAKMGLLHIDEPKSKSNLGMIKNLLRNLPDYLKVTNGKGSSNSAKSIINGVNKNQIITYASASTTQKADVLARGHTLTRVLMDEHAFINHMEEIYMGMYPAVSSAMKQAKATGIAHGMIILTTPGRLSTVAGRYSYKLRNNCTKFNESWYDLSASEIFDMVDSNKEASYVHICYDYKDLGASQAWVEAQIREMGYNWAKIKTEIFLIWEETLVGNPIDQEDLDLIGSLAYDPIKVDKFYNKYLLKWYKPITDILTSGTKVIVGVDTASVESGGSNTDSTALTIIDADDTSVVATMIAKKIPQMHLDKILRDLTNLFRGNIIINIERNHGVGEGVIVSLKNGDYGPSLIDKLFYTVSGGNRDDGSITKAGDGSRQIRSYGIHTNKSTRPRMIDILLRRAKDHRDKFHCKDIYAELQTLIFSEKNNRVEHAPSCHDDLVFSYLVAMYVWYHGDNNIFKFSRKDILTDEFSDEIDDLIYIDEEKGNYLLDGESHYNKTDDDNKSQGLIGNGEESNKRIDLPTYKRNETFTDKGHNVHIMNTQKGFVTFEEFNQIETEKLATGRTGGGILGGFYKRKNDGDNVDNLKSPLDI